ncbi:MAG: hypothetical protein PHQ43_11525, partial [Dehalococcoidales bacterium]|nr:hypothetical protein [Dehalococcoidales bacterium]
DRLYTMAVDELHPLEKAVKAMSGGKPIPIREDPFKAAWLARGWTGKAETYLHHAVVNENFGKVADSLESILKPLGNQLDDFRAYAVSRRSEELRDRGIATGIDRADATEVIKTAPPEFKNVFERLVKYQDAVLEQTLVKSGVLSKDAAQRMRAMNKDYVPFFRLFDESLGTAGFGGKGYANLSSPVKKIKGSGRTIIDPLEGIIKNTYVLTNLAERNKVGSTLVELAEKTDGLGKWVEEVATPMRATKFQLEEIKKQLEAAGADVTGMDLDQAAAVFRPSVFAPGKENILTVYRDGKPRFYQVDPELYRSLLSLDRESTTLLVKILSYPASMLRAGATLNPEFIARNPVRDQWTAYLNSKYGYRIGVDLAKGLFHALKKDDLYWKWQAAGGAQSSLVSVDRDYMQQSIKELLRKGAKEEVKYIASHPLELLRGLSEVLEQGTRLGEFTRGVEKGGESLDSVLEAAIASRDVTVDFARKGTATGPINRVIAFFNAAIQGPDKMRRVFASDPKGFTVRALLAITLPSVLLFLRNHKDERYKELPQWQKDLFWIVLTKNHVFRIPKPFEPGILFGTIPERIMQWALAEDPKAFDELGKTLSDAALPSLVPTALVPWIEVYANKSLHTGAPIVPQREQDLPPEQQFGPYTSETAKMMGSALRQSPRKLESLIAGYTGGLGKAGLQTSDSVLKILGVAKPPPKPYQGLADIPALKAFVVTPGQQAQSVDRFYDALQKAEMEHKRSGKKAVPHKLGQMRNTADELSELRAKERKIEADKTMTPREKRRRLDEINQKMIAEARKRL